MSGDLTLQQLHQWRATLEAKLAVDGDLTVKTNPRRTGYHEFEILVPGYGLRVASDHPIDCAGLYRLDR